MYIHIYTHQHNYIYKCIYVYVCVFMYICINGYLYLYLYLYKHTGSSIVTVRRTQLYIYMFVYLCIYIYLYSYLYLCTLADNCIITAGGTQSREHPEYWGLRRCISWFAWWGHSHVWHDSFIRERWLIHTLPVTCVMRLFSCETWLVLMWYMNRSYARHDSFWHETWLVRMWDMTHSDASRDLWDEVSHIYRKNGL